jgi:multiple sugar transport system permease protein
LKRDTRHGAFWGYLLISPWLIGLLVFTAGPMLASLWLSFCHYDLVEYHYIGLKNYQHLWRSDPLFWKSVTVTATYTLISVPLGLTGSLLLALLLNQRLLGRGLVRAVFYVPTLVPAVASSFLWSYLLNKYYGLINGLLSHFGCRPIDWLGNTKTALPSLVLMSLWGIGGGRMIIFLAGLQEIPESLYEAAAIDGAMWLRQFRHITIPLLTPMIFFNMTLGIIGAFQVFTQAYVMTSGGPENATLFYALHLFRESFDLLRMGYGSALAWVLFFILMVVTAIQFAAARKWVHYEEAPG